jgi:Arc/MetJ-type ribon-helix-helix transcriptional regulator
MVVSAVAPDAMDMAASISCYWDDAAGGALVTEMFGPSLLGNVVVLGLRGCVDWLITRYNTHMNFSVQMPDELVKRLELEAKQLGKTRNAVIRQAVEEMLARKEGEEWPPEFLDLLVECRRSGKVDKRLKPFESYREELPASREFRF